MTANLPERIEEIAAMLAGHRDCDWVSEDGETATWSCGVTTRAFRIADDDRYEAHLAASLAAHVEAAEQRGAEDVARRVEGLADEWEAQYNAPIDQGPGFKARPFYGYFAKELRAALRDGGGDE